MKHEQAKQIIENAITDTRIRDRAGTQRDASPLPRYRSEVLPL